MDPTFDPGSGTDAVVRGVTLPSDGKTSPGCDFATVEGLERAAAARRLGDYALTTYPALGQWRIIHFGAPAATGHAADMAAPFGDGVANLVKDALNMHAPRGPTRVSWTARGTQGR